MGGSERDNILAQEIAGTSLGEYFLNSLCPSLSSLLSDARTLKWQISMYLYFNTSMQPQIENMSLAMGKDKIAGCTHIFNQSMLGDVSWLDGPLYRNLDNIECHLTPLLTIRTRVQPVVQAARDSRLYSLKC